MISEDFGRLDMFHNAVHLPIAPLCNLLTDEVFTAFEKSVIAIRISVGWHIVNS